VPSKAEKLLNRMRVSKSGWKSKDLVTLYLGFGFIISHGSNHDIVKHPDFLDVPTLRDTLPRHAEELAKGYINEAIKRIELLQKLQAQQGTDDE
jgi:hypothetical protein